LVDTKNCRVWKKDEDSLFNKGTFSPLVILMDSSHMASLTPLKDDTAHSQRTFNRENYAASSSVFNSESTAVLSVNDGVGGRSTPSLRSK